jgi:hypothetical protein
MRHGAWSVICLDFVDARGGTVGALGISCLGASDSPRLPSALAVVANGSSSPVQHWLTEDDGLIQQSTALTSQFRHYLSDGPKGADFFQQIARRFRFVGKTDEPPGEV